MAVSIEKKVWHVKTWSDNIVADNIVRHIASKVKGGSKVTISLTKDGLRVVQNAFITGKLLTDYVQFHNIYFVTVNKYYPNCLLIIAKAAQSNKKYHILAFRCATSLDAGMFVNVFKDLKRSTNPGEGFNFELKEDDGVNWTLRGKSAPAEKRQLSTLVNMHDGTAVVERNGDTAINSHERHHPNGNGQIIRAVRQDSDGTKRVVTEVVRESEPEVEVMKINGDGVRHSTAVQAEMKISDDVSESSETSLRDELDYLSHELRDIKFVLEKSTGISAEEYHGKVKTRTVATSKKMETSGTVDFGREFSVENDPIDAVVLHHEDKVNETADVNVNGHFDNPTEETEGNGEVRVFVSTDYRSLGTQTIPKNVPKPEIRYEPVTVVTNQGNPHTVQDANHKIWNRQSTYMGEVKMRTRVSPRSVRPHSVVYSTHQEPSLNGSVSGSLRMRNNDYYVYEPHHSHTVNRGTLSKISTKVPRKIERVYGIGKMRPQTVHGNVVHVGHQKYAPIVPEKAFIYRDRHYYATVDLHHDYNHQNSVKKVVRNSHGDSLIIKT